ncbi:hypothetical protein ACWOAQ_02785 [Helcococcus kunzii]|uniref:DUF5050 domain-containing protein n=1 Tax=Helcococcus kunzii ATCC 51366 TaxID=883114 RepID=H3NLS2_9FIRM|nr:hypothetical protein [Helcococcus kunzii]EHR35729.1 hypothetical protein HMPREF9709_00283 [Helcococcus kunzii ATCC 51366]
MQKRNKYFSFVIFAICLLLSACVHKHKNSEVINKDAKYVTLSTNSSKVDLRSIFSFYDKDGKFLESNRFDDLILSNAIEFKDNIYYYGSKGIIKIDRNKNTIKKILDTSSDNIDEEEGILYYNVNEDFVESSKFDNKSKICKFEEKECVSFNKMIHGFKVLKNNLYIILDSLQSDDETYTLRVYDFNTKKILNEYNVPKGTDLQKADNKIYVIESGKPAYEYGNKENILSNDEYINNLFFNKNNKLIMEKYKHENGNSFLSLYNFTDKKEVVKISDGDGMYYTPYSDTVISMDTANNKFTDLSNNKTIELKQFNNYKTFNALPLE